MKQHPLSAAFPAMSEDEYRALLDSVTSIGVQNPITTFDGMVLDGWNRYRATQELGCDCPEVPLGDVDPRDFVLAQNSARRNLSASQRALAAATCYQWKPVGNPQFRSTSELASQTAVAAAAKVSDTTLRQAKQVVEHGADEVKDAVRSGSLPVEIAAEISKLPMEQQAAAVNGPKAPFRGKPKKGPKADFIRAELKAASYKNDAEQAKSQVEQLEQHVIELTAQLSEARDDVASMSTILEAGDQLAAALQEAKEARDLARGLQERINSMMTQIAELKREAARWKKKAEAIA